MIFQYLRVKHQLFKVYNDVETVKKRLPKQARPQEIKNYTNMLANIDIKDLKIKEQMRLKICKKLRTASLNPKFTVSYKKKFMMTNMINAMYDGSCEILLKQFCNADSPKSDKATQILQKQKQNDQHLTGKKHPANIMSKN